MPTATLLTDTIASSTQSIGPPVSTTHDVTCGVVVCVVVYKVTGTVAGTVVV